MNINSRVISGQLRLGDAEVTSFGASGIIGRIDAAARLAGMTRLLFLPSQSPSLNAAVFAFCRERGIELYFWHKVLSDNAIVPDEDELNVDAWGNRGSGESGVWAPIFAGDESYRFACPRNERYVNLLLGRCRQALSSYDGLFLDYIGFPLPSLGLEALFTCFCPACAAAEPRLPEWRRMIRELRECVVSASDADLDRWGTFEGVVRAFGLRDFFRFRRASVTALVRKFSDMTWEEGKALGIDVLSPSLGALGGHDYGALGRRADWLKPRIYLRTYGPSSIPLEYYCMALGMSKWGKRFTLPALLDFIGRSSNVPLPRSLHRLHSEFLSPAVAAAELAAFRRLTSAPAHVSVECSSHPEYETLLDPRVIREYLSYVGDAEGLVLTWNLLFVPDDYLRLVGDFSSGNAGTV